MRPVMEDYYCSRKAAVVICRVTTRLPYGRKEACMFEDVKIKKRHESGRLRQRDRSGLAASGTCPEHTGPAYPGPLIGNREPGVRDGVAVWVQNGAATLVILSFVGLLFCVLYRESDLPNKDIFNILLGILGTVVVQIFQYWFGASASTPGPRNATHASGERKHP